ncbi:8759_t:CDS:1, partial [Rhizophagus irregularis]
MSNVDTNNNVTFSSSNNSNNHGAFTHHNNQQSNNVFSPPQSYNNQNQPSNPSQSNILPLLNSFGININSPQATIIIIPTTNSDILQRVLAR